VDGVGGVWCWGDNSNRQLGRGGVDTTDDSTPQQVTLPGGLGAIDLGLGDDHSCVVLTDNTVACWGDNDNDQLGTDTGGTDSGDALLVAGLAGIEDVESGDDHTCARDDLGQMWCWGDNIDGQLGDGMTLDLVTPTLVSLPASVDDITLGDDFTCALLVDDAIYCFGEGSDFQLGNGDLVDQPDPGLVLDLPVADLVDIEAGGRGVCATTSDSARYCWGFSESGLLGIAPRSQLAPDPVAFSGPVQQLVLSPPEFRGVLCGVFADGTVECSGDGTTVSASTISGPEGLFDPIRYHLSRPTQLALVSDVQQMGLGDGFACVARSTDVQCWGDNSNLQLGQGGTSLVDILTPSAVMGLGAVDQVAVGDQFACVRTGGSVQCWGDNDSFQAGAGTNTLDQSLPVPVGGLNDAEDIALGENHACALRTGGVVSCWGDDNAGQLGDADGNVDDSAVPVDVTGLPGPATQISIGAGDHSCALVGGEVYCWGDGDNGKLGQGNDLDSDTALLVPGLTDIVRISVGLNFACALDSGGAMQCWGSSEDGQLGDGGVLVTGLLAVDSPTPFVVASGITDVVAGNGTTCVESGGTWSCVGFRGPGHLGNGTTLEPAVPTLMQFGL